MTLAQEIPALEPGGGRWDDGPGGAITNTPIRKAEKVDRKKCSEGTSSLMTIPQCQEHDERMSDRQDTKM